MGNRLHAIGLCRSVVRGYQQGEELVGHFNKVVISRFTALRAISTFRRGDQPYLGGADMQDIGKLNRYEAFCGRGLNRSE